MEMSIATTYEIGYHSTYLVRVMLTRTILYIVKGKCYAQEIFT